MAFAVFWIWKGLDFSLWPKLTVEDVVTLLMWDVRSPSVCQPGLHLRDHVCMVKTAACIWSAGHGWSRCVSSVRLVGDRVSVKAERWRLKNEVDRTKNWSLWDTNENIRRSWGLVIDSHIQSEFYQKPRKNCVRHGLDRLKSVEETALSHILSALANTCFIPASNVSSSSTFHHVRKAKPLLMSVFPPL